MSLLDDRALAFLQESNAIEDITNIDYRLAENASPDAGHVGAFLDSQAKAELRAQLTLDDICRWQAWLTEEQVRFGHPLPSGGAGRLRSPSYPHDVRVGGHIAPPFNVVPRLIGQCLADLNERIRQLKVIDKPELAAILGVERSVFVDAEDMDVAEAIGDVFQRFEAIHPFVDGNGRTGRLIANYIATVFQQPIIVFKRADRAEFFAAHRSPLAMRIFIADRMREAFWFGGRVLERTKVGSGADIYGSNIVERHALLNARAAWAEALAAEDAARSG